MSTWYALDGSSPPRLLFLSLSIPQTTAFEVVEEIVRLRLGPGNNVTGAYVDAEGLHISIHGSNGLLIAWAPGDNDESVTQCNVAE